MDFAKRERKNKKERKKIIIKNILTLFSTPEMCHLLNNLCNVLENSLFSKYIEFEINKTKMTPTEDCVTRRVWLGTRNTEGGAFIYHLISKLNYRKYDYYFSAFTFECKFFKITQANRVHWLIMIDFSAPR